MSCWGRGLRLDPHCAEGGRGWEEQTGGAEEEEVG